MKIKLFFAAIIAFCLSIPSLAHEVRPAYLQLKQTDAQSWEVLWKQPIVQGGRLAIDPIFPEHCELTQQGPAEFTPGAMIYRWQTNCDLLQGQIHIQGLSVTLTDVMVRIDPYGKDAASINHILRPQSPTLVFDELEASTFDYLIIGIEHLVFGIDHVLFVIGLVLFVRSPWMLFKTITAFTVAHSITLALSVLGWVQVQQGPVEAIIALSIVFLARELCQDETARSQLTNAAPWLMAFIFGLLHGLGFAGALRDIGLPEDTLWLSLLLFNVGIELGQLIIIAILAVIGWLATRFMDLSRSVQIGAYAMGIMATYWTIDRTLLLL